MKTIIIVLTIVYFIGLFITYFVLCYQTAKRNYRNDKYEVNLSEGQAFSMIFWPISLVVIILFSPFKLIEKTAIFIKEKTNPKTIDANNLTNKYNK